MNTQFAGQQFIRENIAWLPGRRHIPRIFRIPLILAVTLGVVFWGLPFVWSRGSDLFLWNMWRAAVPGSCVCVTENIYSDEVEVRLSEFVKQESTCKATLFSGSGHMGKELSQRFSLLSSVKCRILQDGTLYIVLRGSQPLFLINNELVLTDNNTLQRKEYFKKYDFAQCGEVFISGLTEENFDMHLGLLLQSVGSEVRNNHIISYESDQYIVLTPRDKHKRYIVVADTASLGDTNKWAKLEAVYQDYQEAVKNKGPKGKLGTIDMRCARQIVVS